MSHRRVIVCLESPLTVRGVSRSSPAVVCVSWATLHGVAKSCLRHCRFITGRREVLENGQRVTLLDLNDVIDLARGIFLAWDRYHLRTATCQLNFALFCITCDQLSSLD